MIEKTYDLDTLGLSAGTYRITVKARASGYSDSNPSNAVNYSVIEKTYTVSGTYTFNETPDVSKAMSIECEFWVNDALGLHRYTKIEIKNNALYYCTADNSYQVYSAGEGWLLNADKKIAFTTEQTVNKEFYEWFTANAVKQEITFTINGTTYYAEEGMTWGEWVDSEYNVPVDDGGLLCYYHCMEQEGSVAFIEGEYIAVPIGAVYRISHGGASGYVVLRNGSFAMSGDTIEAAAYETAIYTFS